MRTKLGEYGFRNIHVYPKDSMELNWISSQVGGLNPKNYHFEIIKYQVNSTDKFMYQGPDRKSVNATPYFSYQDHFFPKYTLFFNKALFLIFSFPHYLMTSSSPISHHHQTAISTTDRPSLSFIDMLTAACKPDKILMKNQAGGQYNHCGLEGVGK